MCVYLCVHAFGGLTPGGWAGIGCCGGESYVRGGRDSVYVVELTEHRGAPPHRSLKRTASLECAHYLHLQDKDKTAALSEVRKGWSECAHERLGVCRGHFKTHFQKNHLKLFSDKCAGCKI